MLQGKTKLDSNFGSVHMELSNQVAMTVVVGFGVYSTSQAKKLHLFRACMLLNLGGGGFQGHREATLPNLWLLTVHLMVDVSNTGRLVSNIPVIAF